ncbi:MAG: hypothetical protein VW840_07735 [Gammaproteobacteria bacterium]
MSTSTNELGFGSLSSVAWSDMTGTDLTADQLAEVNEEIATDLTISNTLLQAINEAVSDDRTSFSLSDLGDVFLLTSINSDVPARDDDANDWADYISGVTGNQISASNDLSLSEWRRIAAELQDDASLQASKRDPAGEGGGIKATNGNWFINGQQVSLLDAYMAVRVNQVANFDDSLNVYISELNENNRLIKAANEWLAELRTNKPNDADTGNSIRKAQIDAFKAEWGFDPIKVFHPTDLRFMSSVGDWNPPAGYTQWDSAIDNIKGYIDSKDTENQTVQQKLEQMTNRRSEVLDGLTSFAKAQTQTGRVFAQNLG